MKNRGCNYEPCSCTGVHFICRYKSVNDYCVDGVRIHIEDGTYNATVSCSGGELAPMETFLRIMEYKHQENIEARESLKRLVAKWPTEA